MKKKRIIILILQLVIIIIAAIMFMNTSKNTVKPTEVYLFERDILDVDTPIKEGDVRLASIPNAAVTADFATDINEIIGKYVDGKVRAGQYVYKNQLVTIDQVDPFEQMDLSKHRKISLPINFVDGFSGNIKKGDLVDLVYTGAGKTEGDENSKESEFYYALPFLQEIPVYSVNTEEGFKFKDRSNYAPGNLDEESPGDSNMAVITLAVTLEEAAEIKARAKSGEIGFLGRFDDSKSYNALGFILGDYEKIFSGKGAAETGNMLIDEDDFDFVE